jgi:hypothetical protein
MVTKNIKMCQKKVKNTMVGATYSCKKIIFELQCNLLLNKVTDSMNCTGSATAIISKISP